MSCASLCLPTNPAVTARIVCLRPAACAVPVRQEHARHEAALRQLQELTLHPEINRNYGGVQPAISLKHPGPYLAEVPTCPLHSASVCTMLSCVPCN